jgi:hypothetical protein
VLALIGLLLLNLMAVAVPDAGAIEICAADGGVRLVLPDGSPAPEPQVPAHDGPLCEHCMAACVHGCAAACGKAPPALAAVVWPDRKAGDPRLHMADVSVPPSTPDTSRPRAQGPPPLA